MTLTNEQILTELSDHQRAIAKTGGPAITVKSFSWSFAL